MEYNIYKDVLMSVIHHEIRMVLFWLGALSVYIGRGSSSTESLSLYSDPEQAEGSKGTVREL